MTVVTASGDGSDSKPLNKLQEIVLQRRQDVEEAKQTVSEQALLQQIQAIEHQLGAPINVLQRLNQASSSSGDQHHARRLALAAEFKRASPSKGDIAVHLGLEEQVALYAAGGASMISVLTEPKYFKGSLDDLKRAAFTLSTRPNRPVLLRKDFIFDRYQLLEARAFGADCVLLIVNILTPSQLQQLIQQTLELGMFPLVEVNSLKELDIALQAQAKLIGVNNRNLQTFKLDLNTTVQIAKEIQNRQIALGPEGITLFALSGIHSREDVVKFEQCGARGILVGESLMKSADVSKAIDRLLSDRPSTESFQQPIVKVCGITTPEDALLALRNGANLIGIICVEKSKRCVEIPQAQAIARAVRAYGERTEPFLQQMLDEQVGTFEQMVAQSNKTPTNELLPPTPSRFGASPRTEEWFQKNSSVLRQACHCAPMVVGVFANKAATEINRIAAEIGLDLVQLHGDEGYEICREIALPTIRVVHLPATVGSDSVDAEAILQSVKPGFANFLLLDTTVQGQQGGTGKTFDWRIAALFATARIPCLVAGGLTPENVNKAIGISCPLGIDVSSGVEMTGSPGVKDPAKVAAFLKSSKFYWQCAATTIEEENDA